MPTSFFIIFFQLNFLLNLLSFDECLKSLFYAPFQNPIILHMIFEKFFCFLSNFWMREEWCNFSLRRLELTELKEVHPFGLFLFSSFGFRGPSPERGAVWLEDIKATFEVFYALQCSFNLSVSIVLYAFLPFPYLFHGCCPKFAANVDGSVHFQQIFITWAAMNLMAKTLNKDPLIFFHKRWNNREYE